MTGLAFNMEWDGDGTGPEGPNAEMGAPRRATSEGQGKAAAWEIQFSDTPGRKKFPPKFLKSSPDQEKKSPSSPSMKPTSMRSSSTPMKANGTRSFVKPAALAALSKPKTKSVTKPSLSERDISPKKQLPAIRKPLLPVTSPTKKPSRFPDLKSKSECILSPQMPSKAAAATGLAQSKQRSHSASPTVSSAGRKQAQIQQSPLQQKLGQENKQCVGVETQKPQSPQQQKLIQGSKQQRVEPARSRVVKEDDKPTLDKRELTKRTSLPVVSVPPTDSSHVGSRPAMSPGDMAQRKVLDLKRWYCVSHPQYSKSCGISSVVSCWNFLFSTLGNGTLPPVTQERALTLLGFEPPFGEIRFGPFTGNMTCMRWFQTLCDHYGTNGRSYYLYKPVGPRKTVGMRPSMALEKLQEGLSSPDTAFIYHCSNHYFCPIGYEQVPKLATDAYRINLRPSDVDTWILIGEPSRNQSAIHCKRWEHIVKDLTCELPQYFNIRHTEKGILTKTTKRAGSNLHCIMAFKKLQDSFIVPIFDPSHTGDDSPSLSEVEELNSSDSDLPSSPRDFTRGGESWDGRVPNVDDVDLGTIASSPVQTNADSKLMEERLSGSDDNDCGAEAAMKNDEHEPKLPVLRLRRSGTFTKEKPILKVEQPRPLSSDSESSVDASNVSDRGAASSTQEPKLPVLRLRRSGTFTKEKPILKVEQPRPLSSDSESSVDASNVSDRGAASSTENLTEGGSDSEGDSAAVSETSQGDVDSGSPVVRLKRSGTFTKEKPSVLCDTFDPNWEESVDLDDTLKSSDYF